MGWIWLILLFLTCFFIFTMIYKAFKEKEYFRKKNVYYLGNAQYGFWRDLIFQKKAFTDVLNLQYANMKKNNAMIAGTVDMGMNTYTIRDVEILRHIFVKDFDHFFNRRGFQIPGSDELASRMLIFLRDDQWKNLRSKMSPTFTTGKIKRMFQLFDQSSRKLVKFVEQEMDAATEGEMDLQEGYSKFTMDTIASVVCGMDSQAFNQKEPSVFEQVGKNLQFRFKAADMFRFIVMFQFPKLAAKLGLTFFGKDTHAFFSGAIKESIKRRKETGEKPNDFIQLMLEAREGKLKAEEEELSTFEKDALINEKEGEKNPASIEQLLDDDGIVSNCVLFILAGFDTTQSLLLYCAYALALHPEIQETLREEIEQTLDENNGKFTYESLHKMAYLDMVINETLRFYPPAAVTDRGCTKDYLLPGTDIMLKKGDGILAPILGMHHDPDLYENPEKFDPLRFSPENKGKIHPYAFLPFGLGPRNCIGMRFALTEVKLAIAQLVNNFNIEPSKQTLIPMVYDNVGSLKPKGGMWLAMKKRNK